MPGRLEDNIWSTSTDFSKQGADGKAYGGRLFVGESRFLLVGHGTRI